MGTLQRKPSSNGRLPVVSQRMQDQLVLKWAPVRMIAIDEAPMMEKEMLHEVSCRIQTAKECALDFGGVHVLFCGDFAQLPPVVGQPLYNAPKKSGVKGICEVAAYELYRLFTTGYLRVNMRAVDDSCWSAVLRRMHVGALTAQDGALFSGLVGSKRRLGVLSAELTADAVERGSVIEMPPLHALCPVVVATNKKRFETVWTCMQAGGRRNLDVRNRPVLIP